MPYVSWNDHHHLPAMFSRLTLPRGSSNYSGLRGAGLLSLIQDNYEICRKMSEMSLPILNLSTTLVSSSLPTRRRSGKTFVTTERHWCTAVDLDFMLQMPSGLLYSTVRSIVNGKEHNANHSRILSATCAQYLPLYVRRMMSPIPS